jgi:hypothetical protein
VLGGAATELAGSLRAGDAIRAVARAIDGGGTAAVGVDDAAAVARAGAPVVAGERASDGPTAADDTASLAGGASLSDAVGAVPDVSPLGTVSAAPSPDGGAPDRGHTPALPDVAPNDLPLPPIVLGLAAAGVAIAAGAWVVTSRIRRRRVLDARVAARLAALAGPSPREGPRGFRPASLSLDAREGVSLSSHPTRAAQARRL